MSESRGLDRAGSARSGSGRRATTLFRVAALLLAAGASCSSHDGVRTGGGDVVGGMRYLEYSVWDRYRWPIVATLSLCALEGLLIVALLTQRRRRARAEAALGERLRFETIVADASHAFTRLPGDRIDAEVRRWLCNVASALDVDAAAVARVGDGALAVTHSSDRQGADVAVRLPATDGDTTVALRRGDVVTVRGERGIAPLILVPLSVGGELWGALALRSLGGFRTALDPSPERLRLLGEVLANALARGRAAAELAAQAAALRESRAEYRRLADRLIAAQEEERRRISRELHDDIAQRLTAVGFEVEGAERDAGSRAGDRRAALARLAAQVSAVVGDVTRLSHRLHPSLLDQIGLVPALRALCRDFTVAPGFTASFLERDAPPSVPPPTALALYRVAQEALRNAVKHSGAAHASVVLVGRDDGVLALEVVDAGVGFDVEAVRGNGSLGLVSMSERVQMLGGTLVVRSAPSAGTSIVAHVPLVPAGERAPESAPSH